MFTQCDRCATVFRLAPAALRAAGGQVRCGRCGEVFDALARLAEDGSSFAHRESSPDLASRAGEILRATGEGAEPGTLPTAPTTPMLAEEPALSAFEFSLPPGELDRIFIETSPGILNVLTADRGPVDSGSTDAVDTGAVDSAAVAPVEPESQPGHLPITQPPSAEAAPGAPTVVADTPAHRADTAVLDMPHIAPPRKRVPMSVWSAAALLLGALLLTQIFVAGGGRSVGQSSRLGKDATLGATLSAYQLRQWGVSAEPTVAGTLRVRASIMNTSAQSQPYPLLRLTLANRFGTRLGEREFAPAEYLGQQPAAALAPGARVDATLNIVDPGKSAEGFELDVCMRDADQRPHCAGDAAAHAKQ